MKINTNVFKSIQTTDEMQFILKFNSFCSNQQSVQTFHYLELLQKQDERRIWLILLIFMLAEIYAGLEILRLAEKFVAFSRYVLKL